MIGHYPEASNAAAGARKGAKTEDGRIAKRYPLIELFKDGICRHGLFYRDFELVVPKGAGIGVTVDEEKLALYRRGRS